MALIEEVWGSLTPSSPPEPKKPEKSAPAPQPDIASPTTQPLVVTQETFQSPKPNKNLSLFLAVLITGICSIYAVDMFAETIRRS
jgi:hypothetical protein